MYLFDKLVVSLRFPLDFDFVFQFVQAHVLDLLNLALRLLWLLFLELSPHGILVQDVGEALKRDFSEVFLIKLSEFFV